MEQIALVPGVGPYFFRDDETGLLPVFIGTTDVERARAYQQLNRTDKKTQFRRAAIAASFEDERGRRTDLGDVATRRQEFCRAVGIGEQHCSRLGRTYRVIAELVATGSNRSEEMADLLQDDALCFKHYLVAANYAVQPLIALREARDLGWTANHLHRMLASRTSATLIDDMGDRSMPSDDDDDPSVELHGLPDRAPPSNPPHTRPLFGNVRVTVSQQRHLAALLRELRQVLNTTTDLDTLVALASRAHAEWVVAARSSRRRSSSNTAA